MKSLNKKRKAFTLAEMMVVMLLLSIVLAASMPIMTKRAAADADKMWKRTITDAAKIYYGTGNGQRVLIGAKDADKAKGKLTINCDGTSVPQISLLKDGTEKAKISVNNSNQLELNGDVKIVGKLDVTGATTLSDTLKVTNAAELANTLKVTGATTLSNTLDVSGKSTLNAATATKFYSSGNITSNSKIGQGAVNSDLTNVSWNAYLASNETKLAGSVNFTQGVGDYEVKFYGGSGGWLYTTTPAQTTYDPNSRKYSKSEYCARYFDNTPSGYAAGYGYTSQRNQCELSSGNDNWYLCLDNNQPTTNKNTCIRSHTTPARTNWISDRRLKNIKENMSIPGQGALDIFNGLNIYYYTLSAPKQIELEKKKFDRLMDAYYKEELKKRLSDNKEGVKGQIKITSELKKEISKLKEQKYNQIKEKAIMDSKEVHLGIIAQEMEVAYPNGVIKDEDGYLYLKQNNDLLYIAIIAVKELNRRIEEIKKRIVDIDEEVIYHKRRFQVLEAFKIKTIHNIKQLEKENKELRKQNAEIMRRLEQLEKKVK